MAEQETPKAKTATPPTPPPIPVGDRIPVDRLIAEAEGFLGQPHYVAAGAFHGVKKDEMTVAEARALIDEWLKKPVGKE